jgi:hypothetical protein
MLTILAPGPPLGDLAFIDGGAEVVANGYLEHGDNPPFCSVFDTLTGRRLDNEKHLSPRLKKMVKDACN